MGKNDIPGSLTKATRTRDEVTGVRAAATSCAGLSKGRNTNTSHCRGTGGRPLSVLPFAMADQVRGKYSTGGHWTVPNGG